MDAHALRKRSWKIRAITWHLACDRERLCAYLNRQHERGMCGAVVDSDPCDVREACVRQRFVDHLHV